MSPTILKPSMRGSCSANKVKVGSTTRSVLKPNRSSNLVILCDNYKPKGSRTVVSNSLVRIRKDV